MPSIDSVPTTTTSAPLRPLMGCSGLTAHDPDAALIRIRLRLPASLSARGRASLRVALSRDLASTDVMAVVGRLRLRRAPQHPRDPPGTDRSRHCASPSAPSPICWTTSGELRALASGRPQAAGGGTNCWRQRHVILAFDDGLQPDVGHEVLWVLRDCLSGEILLAKSLLSSTTADLAGLISEVQTALPVPITGVVSDGQGKHPQGGGQGPARYRAAPALPLPLSPRGRRANLRADRHAENNLKKPCATSTADRARRRAVGRLRR